MADERAREAAERVFGILALPTYDDAFKLQMCIRYLQTCTDDVFADFPRECKAIVAGAFEYGATWQMVADAADIGVVEAKRRWADVAEPGTP
jgi:hypothetical protein